MDILIRNLEPAAVHKIDELAREKGMSRNEYLKNSLESLAFLTIKDGIVYQLEKQIEANSIVMRQTVNTLDELISILKELIAD